MKNITTQDKFADRDFRMVPVLFPTAFETPLNPPFYTNEALEHSVHDMAAYISQHTDTEGGLTLTGTLMIATARLNMILDDTRKSLAGMFSHSDLLMLMNCFLDAVFHPYMIRGMASWLCDEWGIEGYENIPPQIAPLAGKLRSLDIAQRMALADALEQAWYRGKRDNLPPADVFSELGIELSAE